MEATKMENDYINFTFCDSELELEFNEDY